MLFRSTRSSSGLRRYAVTPSARHCSDISGVSCAVMITVGSARRSAFRACSTCRPVMPGMCRSRIRQSSGWSVVAARNSLPLAYVSTWKPDARSSRFKAFRTGSSSSTMATYGTVSLIGAGHGPARNWTKVSWTKVLGGPVLVLQDGKLEEEPRSPPGPRLPPEPAAVRAQDRLGDRQAEADTLRLGGVEGLEHPFVLLGAAARAGVLDADHDPALDPAGAHRQAARRGGARRAHRLAAVHHQVEHHLLQFDAVAVHRRQAGFEVALDLDRAGDQIAAHDVEHFADQRVDLERAELRLAALEQRAQAVDHVACALIGDDDVVQDLGQHLRGPGLVGEEVLRGLRVGEDRGQRLVELVGDAARELAEH